MPIRQVFSGVTLIDLPWVNAYLLHKGCDAVLIDTGTHPDRKRVLAALCEVLPDRFRLTSILLTHGHSDHAGNAALLADRFDAQLVAHRLEEPYVTGNKSYAPGGLRTLGPSSLLFHLGDVFWPVARRKIDRFIADGECVDTPIGPLRVVHTPGHTMGHVSYYHEKEGWLFSGDALITVVPVWRRAGLCLPMPIFSSDLVAARKSAERIAAIGPSALLSGHGWPWVDDTAGAIRRFLGIG